MGDNMENNRRNNKYFKYHKYGHNDGNYFKNKNHHKNNNYNKKDIDNNILLQEEKLSKKELEDRVFNKQHYKDSHLKLNHSKQNKGSIEDKDSNVNDLEYISAKKRVEKDSFISPKLLYFKISLGIIILIVLIFGASYAYFNYYHEDSRQADIAGGEAYVRVDPSQKVDLALTKLYPRTNEEARSRNDNYIDFKVEGKNTSSSKVLYYSIDITNGTSVQNKVRISPQYIKVDLQEKINGEYTYIKNGISLNDFNFDGIIPANTNSKIEREFRLRIWISDNIIISDTEENATFTQSEFANLYANFHVSVNAYDKDPTCPGPNCVYRKSTTSKSKNDAIGTLGTDYENTYTGLGNYFLGHILNSDGLTIKMSYVCGINNGNVFCLKGGINETSLTDKPVFVENINRLNTAFPTCNASSQGSSSSCTALTDTELDGTVITVYSNGSVSIGNSCSVSSLGVSSCQ